MSDEDDVSFEELFGGARVERRAQRSRASPRAPMPTFDAAAVFDSVVHGSGAVPAELAGQLEVIAAPGDPIAGRLRPDDIVVRRGLGEGRLAHVSLAVESMASEHAGFLGRDQLVLRRTGMVVESVFEDDLAQEDRVALDRIREQLRDRPAISLTSTGNQQGGRASTIAVVVRSSVPVQRTAS